MTQSHEAPPRRDDHFFLACQRWLQLHEVASVLLVCHGQPRPLGTKHRPAIEVPGCLRELPLHRLVDLHLAGVRDVAVPPDACCPECDSAATIGGWSVLGDLLALKVMEAAPVRTWAWTVSPSRVPVDRRGLLGLSRQASPSLPTHDVGADDRTRLLTSLRTAGVASLDATAPGVVKSLAPAAT